MSEAPKMAGQDRRNEAPASVHAGRFAAGEDPVKREQILDGARRIFMRLGFDGASMNDVTREAGVSKGTIYVYFSSKEDLFAALVEREKNRFTTTLREILAGQDRTEDALSAFATAFIRQITTTDMIPAMRSVLGVVERMPGLCRRFFSGNPVNAVSVLGTYLEQEAAAGRLVIADTDLAARQFIDLSTGSFFKRRLFEEISTFPPEDEVGRFVSSAVAMFMKTYGAGAASA